MNETAEKVEEARALLASGREPQATKILADAIDATDDPELLREILELAVEGHERSSGMHKIHWHELMIDAEARQAHSVA